MHLRFLLTLLSFLFFQSTPPADDPPADDPPKDDPPAKPEFTAEQQKVINDWIAKERKKAEEDAAARIKAQADEAKRKADADAERKRQEAAGEFDQVKASLESERDSAVTERDAIKAERDRLHAYVTADVASVAKAVTDAAKDNGAAKILLGFHPGDEASVEQLLTWTEKAKAQLPELIATPAPRGNGPNPKPADRPDPIDVKKEAARKAKALRF